VSYICEALILIYLGISIDSFEGTTDMVYYALVDFSILLISRFFTIFLLSGFLGLVTKGKMANLKFKDIILVGFAGMIRGSLAYALMVKLANHGIKSSDPAEMKSQAK
jgi:sodium/hydrogen exchanger 8